MQKFLRQSTFNDYHEQLADERAETERLFILTVLARKARKSADARHVDVVVEGRSGNNG